MDVLQLITTVIATAASTAGLLLTSDQLTRGTRERRLELFIREAAGQGASPVLDSIRRTLVARAIARNAVPATRCILPIVLLAACCYVIGVSAYTFTELETSVKILTILLPSVVTAFPAMALALWYHERRRVIQALEPRSSSLYWCGLGL